MKSIIFGCSSTALTDEERTFFQNTQPLGFILFKRNIENPKQLTKLVEDLKKCVNHKYVPFFIDQEGGKVNRLTPPEFADNKPPAKFFGDLAKDGLQDAKDKVFQNYLDIGNELFQYGINVDCAPVADLFDKNANIVIGDRSFGDSPEIIVEMCKSSIKGLQSAGVEAVIKHIPGHGRANADSHHELPVITTTLTELEASDFAIFKQLTEAKWAMTAHIIYEALDPSTPATQSKTAIDYIRNNIGYKNAIITDDINMKALSGSLAEITERCYQAGCDVILHCSGKMDEMKEIAQVLQDVSENLYELIKPENFNPDNALFA